MKAQDIKNAENLFIAIRNFRECYSTCVLSGSAPDGIVNAETIIAWLIENPHMAEIAADIKKLSK